MKKFIFFIPIILLTACISRNTEYRVLDKNGKIIYFERKKPKYNDSIRNDKKEIENISSINKKIKNNNITTVDNTQQNKINDNLVLDSSAYTLKSVISTVVKDDDVGQLTKVIDNANSRKIIDDFNIPEYYFDDSKIQPIIDEKPTSIDLAKIKKVEIKKVETTEKEKTGFFSNLFKKNKTNDTVESDIKLDIKSRIKNKLNKDKNKTDINNNIDNTKNKDKGKSVDNNQNTDSKDKVSSIVIGKAIFNKNQKLGQSNTNLTTNNSKNNKDNGKDNKNDVKNNNKDNKKLDTKNNSIKKDNSVIDNNKNKKTYVLNSDKNSQKSNVENKKIFVLDNKNSQQNSIKNGKDKNQKLGQSNTNLITNNSKNNKDNKNNKNNNDKAVVSKTPIDTKTNSQYMQKGKYYIQIGSLSDVKKANELLKKFSFVGDGGAVVPTSVNNKTMYKVVYGTFNSKELAEKEMEKILNKGHFDCYVLKK